MPAALAEARDDVNHGVFLFPHLQLPPDPLGTSGTKLKAIE